MNTLRLFALLFTLQSVFLLGSPQAFAEEKRSLDSLPVQDSGRIKPFDTFARETLQLIWGREKFNDRKAVDVILSWMLVPEEVEKKELILIRHAGLREALGLPNERLHFTINELMLNPKVGLMLQDLRGRRENKEKLDPFFQAVQTLENQISLFQALRMGALPGVAPSGKSAAENPTDKWESPAELTDVKKQNFQAITQAFASYIGDQNSDKKAALESTVARFVTQLEAQHGDYSGTKKISAEIFYNRMHPFMFAWICYLISAILFIVVLFGNTNKYKKFAWGFISLGLFLHVVGFALRVFITGRAPVTNMYETVVWVAFGAVMISIVLHRFWKNTIIMVAAATVATFSLILCDISNHVLDGSINPLEPVLRDNFWLTTHVLTITLSYAAFFLAFIVGDITLFYFLKDEKKFAAKIADASNAMYRSIQVGVVLLAGGVILGGIWADYSWGRFWGWDPKETWAFIALMGYIAILHGRLAGWLRNFGLATTSVLAFSTVVMAWYGVNFVLGAGLHTYGFGAGGVEWVAGFVAIHVLFVIYVVTLRQSRLKQSRPNL